MTNTQVCPCGSEQELSNCCLPVIQGKKPAPTAEALMRARYTAFVRNDVDFILASHHSRTRGEVKRDEVEDWSRNSEWLGLEIVQTHEGNAADQKGAVVFHARYRPKQDPEAKPTEHWEHALFEKEEGHWRFVDAQPVKTGPIERTEPKIGRNDPCKCGSGMKFKKCCGK